VKVNSLTYFSLQKIKTFCILSGLFKDAVTNTEYVRTVSFRYIYVYIYIYIYIKKTSMISVICSKNISALQYQFILLYRFQNLSHVFSSNTCYRLRVNSVIISVYFLNFPNECAILSSFVNYYQVIIVKGWNFPNILTLTPFFFVTVCKGVNISHIFSSFVYIDISNTFSCILLFISWYTASVSNAFYRDIISKINLGRLFWQSVLYLFKLYVRILF
jgi:hypothetical protein